jgi:N-acyl-D-amino-acid deacylase
MLRSTLALLLTAASLGAQGTPEFDVLIRGGTVIDGTGAARYAADVALRGDRIALVSRTAIAPARARRVIDATGKIVAPGFIDLHAHLDPLAQMPDAESHVRQGVTTAVGGPDGGSPLPLAPYLAARETQQLGMNVAFLVGHNSIRQAVMGMVARDPTTAELAQMKQMVAQGMADGAWGISTGLKYLPGAYSKTSELIELSKIVAASGGIYTSHLREEGLGLLGGVREAIDIGRGARIPIVLTHHKAVGTQMWGKSTVTLAMVDSARRQGIDVMMDVYPYTATQTGIDVLAPPWAFDGGDSAFARRLRDPKLRDSIKKDIVYAILTDRGGGDLRRVQFGEVRWMRALEGKTLADWAAQRNMAPTPENGAELVIEAITRGGARCIYHVLDEGDVRRIMSHAQTMIASDGRLARPGEGQPHPRAYGTFPRVLGEYARDQKLFSLETGVHKMTGMPATRLGLADRGVLKAGSFADIAVFDAAKVRDLATFAAPHQYPEGIDFVIVNGTVTVDGGRFTTARAGKVLRSSRSRGQSR